MTSTADDASTARPPHPPENAGRATGTGTGTDFAFPPSGPEEEAARRAVLRATDHLLARQHAEGYWLGFTQTDVSFDVQDLLCRLFLGILDDRLVADSGRFIRSQQRADGTWPLAPDADGHLGTTIQAYVALRLAGDSPDEAHMLRAAAWVRAQGGVAASQLISRYWLALFGWCSWDDLPEIPPEIIALPDRAPLSIYSFASYARVVLVPLAVISAHRPVRSAPFAIDELFVSAGPPAATTAKAPLPGRERASQRLNSVLRAHRKAVPRPARRAALAACTRWLIERQEADGSWNGYTPTTVYPVLALHLQGYALDHPVIKAALGRLDAGWVRVEGDKRMVETVLSPVWDTALSVTALADAGLPPGHPALTAAADWLLGRQTTRRGDWAVRRPRLAPGGWSYEFDNQTYPDNDDTSEVILALRRTGHPDRARVDAAVDRGAQWARGMQSEDGGWGAFDADNTSTLPGRLPFFDFSGYCTDPPTPDVTAHVVEMLAFLGQRDDVRTRRGVGWLLAHQEDDGSWYGRWGVNHVYGTGCVVPALVTAGVPAGAPAVRRAVTWLVSVQNGDGGWGEDWHSYEDRSRIGKGPSTPSQTAWALLALLAAGERDGSAVRAGITWLTDRQTKDGTWDEHVFTATGVPGVDALSYGLYRHVFPLTALGRYARRQDTGAPAAGPSAEPSAG
ncbi:squalene--hopene cyclase [Streptomyces minutiscleroticus]|uniref:Squalene-hopene cyclase n=1 Tax=Streptomyces minutiscleroticus TaxID=68238 RepID=A0A918U870_9ACTN|nr:squalene--hopene cyclase [Streptomyces minutiscleroticus]GGY07803.1 squalene-hopene cyclase [Streptomyces minutiscleroticus]